MHLMYPASTQACAVIILAFQEHGIDNQALMCLIEEWTQLGIVKVCFTALQLRHVHVCDLLLPMAFMTGMLTFAVCSF